MSVGGSISRISTLGDFDAPSSGLLVEAGADDLVDALALRQDLVEAHVTDYSTQRRGCKSDDG